MNGPVHLVWPGEVSATFEPRDGTADWTVLREVWDEGVYVRHPAELHGKRVLDLGANIGAFTVLAAKAGARRVVAVEPEPGNLVALRRHVHVNDVDVDVVEAVVNRYGEARYITGVDGTAHTSAAACDGPLVRGVTASSLVSAFGPFDLVKIDVEGDEWGVLFDLLANAMSGVGAIVAEIHGPGMCEHLADRAELVMVEFDTSTRHEVEVGLLLARLAEFGSVSVVGRPSVGGTLRWTSYTPPSQEAP